MSQAAQSQLSEGCTPGEALGLEPANTAAAEVRVTSMTSVVSQGSSTRSIQRPVRATIGPTAQNEGSLGANRAR